LSRSLPPTLDDAEPNAQTLIEDSGAPGFGGNDHVPLETTGISILKTLSLFLQNFFRRLADRLIGFFSGHHSDCDGDQRQKPRARKARDE
jgi:hypothetical protein